MKRFVLFCLGSLLLTLSLRAIVDINGNGISDIWERQYNNGQPFNPPIHPAADADSDGWTNAQEAVVGTNPFDARPPSGFLNPDIINIPAVWGVESGNPVLISPNTIRVSWQTIPGKQYILLFSPDLTAQSWLPVEDAYVGNGTITEYYFPLDQPTSNFWRVKVEDVDFDDDGVTEAEEMAFGLDPNQPQSISGIADAWLAKNFTDLLLNGGLSMIDLNADPDGDGTSTLDEYQNGTDPNSADAEGSRKWVTVQGNGAALQEITRTGTLTIPAGKSAILVVAIASEEFPYYTESQSQFNDLLEWHVTPSQGTAINGYINVNERHLEWEMDIIDGTTLPGLPSPVHIEQTRLLTAPPDTDLTIQVEVSATNYSDGALPSLVSVGLLPGEVSWKEISGYGNVSDHIDPWDPTLINGKRIFPCAKNPDEPAILDKLELVVKTLPFMAGKTVYVKAFDVDDTTSEDFDLDETGSNPIIDTNGKAGSDNHDDYKQTPKNGQFWTGSAWGSNESNAVIDSNGEARFIFGVGMQPGNNYRVVASLDDATPLAAVQVSDPDAPSHLGSESVSHVGLPYSPLLTVWRKLWVENDSMEAIPRDQFGYKRNDLSWDLDPPAISSTIVGNAVTSFSIPQISDQGSFDSLENGRIILKSISYPVVGTAHYGASPYFVTVAGQVTGIPDGSGFRLYDDDEYGLLESSLPRNDLANDLMRKFFVPAFIEITDAGAYNQTKEVPFQLHDPLLPENQSVTSNARELQESQKLWVAPLTAAYQLNMLEDEDPKFELPTYGATTTINGIEQSVVYVESCREEYDAQIRLSTEQGGSPQHAIDARNDLQDYIIAVAAHEIGHQPGVQDGEVHHAEMGLMRVGGVNNLRDPGADDFAAPTILRFRKSTLWSK